MISSNLLQYTIVPTKLTYGINDGGLQRRKMPDTQYYQQKTNNTYIEISTEDATVTIDTYNARASMGYGQYNDADMVKNKAQEGKEKCAEGTRERVREGDMLMNLMKPSEIARRKMLSEAQYDTITVFFPKGGADVSVERGSAESDYTPTTIDFNWEDAFYEKHGYNRASVDFNVVQRAYVDIQYMGSPLYFPPDAAPLFAAKA